MIGREQTGNFWNAVNVLDFCPNSDYVYIYIGKNSSNLRISIHILHYQKILRKRLLRVWTSVLKMVRNIGDFMRGAHVGAFRLQCSAFKTAQDSEGRTETSASK